MSVRLHRASDRVDVLLHGAGVGPWRGDGSALALCRANGAEEKRVLVALIGGLARSGSAPRPLPYDAVLLADARLVLEPQLYRRAVRNVLQMCVERVREVFLKAAMISGSCAG